MVDAGDNVWRSRAPGPYTHTKPSEAGYGQRVDRGAWIAKAVKRPGNNRHNLNTPTDVQTAHHATSGTPTTGLRERGNNTSKSTGCSGRHKAATRRNMRRKERVTVEGPVKKQQPGGMSHRG